MRPRYIAVSAALLAAAIPTTALLLVDPTDSGREVSTAYAAPAARQASKAPKAATAKKPRRSTSPTATRTSGTSTGAPSPSLTTTSTPTITTAPTSTPTTTTATTSTPTTSTPTATTAPAGSPTVSGGQAVRFSADSFWTATVRTAPVGADSAAQTAELVRQVKAWRTQTAGFDAYEYNVSFYTVPAGAPRVNLTYTNCLGGGVWDGIYTQAAHFSNVPMPADATPAPGSDGTVAVYSPSTDQLWEFWKVEKASSGWRACWGGRIDNVSANQGIFPQGWGVAASGTAMSGGMVTPAEIRRGRIDHAISITVPSVAPKGTYSWPANRSDGLTGSTSPLMEGSRLRLDPNLVLDTYKLTPIGKMIARAAQEYGFVIDNKSTVVGVVAQSGLAEKQSTGTDPWDTLLGGVEPWFVMTNFPWEKVQFLPKDYGTP